MSSPMRLLIIGMAGLAILAFGPVVDNVWIRLCMGVVGGYAVGTGLGGLYVRATRHD